MENHLEYDRFKEKWIWISRVGEMCTSPDLFEKKIKHQQKEQYILLGNFVPFKNFSFFIWLNDLVFIFVYVLFI